MKKLITFLFTVLFVGTMLSGCADAQADEIYNTIVPEKGDDGDAGPGHSGGGPGGGG